MKKSETGILADIIKRTTCSCSSGQGRSRYSSRSASWNR